MISKAYAPSEGQAQATSTEARFFEGLFNAPERCIYSTFKVKIIKSFINFRQLIRKNVKRKTSEEKEASEERQHARPDPLWRR